MARVLPEDIYKIKELYSPVFSPDGKKAVFSVMQADRDKNGYDMSLWLWREDGGVSRLTRGGSDGGAFWEDDDHIVFSSGRSPKLARYFRIDVRGGEAEPIPGMKGGGFYKKFGDGRSFYVKTERAEPLEKKWELGSEPGKDYDVFEETPFWFDERGVINRLRSSLTVCGTDGAERKLTPKFFNVGMVAYSPDEKFIAYSGAEYEDVVNFFTKVYIYDVEKDESRLLFGPEGLSCPYVYWCGDRIVSYAWEHLDSHSNMRPFSIDPATGEYTEMEFGDANMMLKYKNGMLYGAKNYWYMRPVTSYDMTGREHPIAQPEGAVSGFDVRDDGAVIMCEAVGCGLPELYLLTPDGRHTRLSDFNSGYLASVEYFEPEYRTFKDRDGVTLECHVIKPAGYVPGKKYPGILYMHGGPKGTYTRAFTHDMQAQAARGYFVFYTNPRGSDGRGQDFADVTDIMGTIDMNDFMDFTDFVLSEYPDIDPERLGVTGGSYGGFMTNWLIGHTDRFKAAASQRSIANYMTKLLCCDNGISFDIWQVSSKNGFADDRKIWDNSPLKYAPNAVTPTLFIQSSEDYRCWIAEGVQMYTALMMKGVPCRMCVFKGESHGLVRNGKPENRIAVINEIAAWMDKYLG